MNAINKNEVSMFKVGDDVVYADIKDSCVLKYEGEDNNPFKLHWLSYPDGTTGYIFSLDRIRHATPEEIEVGHRINCEILDHPEDYTSPNRKKYDERVG